MSAYDAPGWGGDEYDGPAAFAEAAEYLARWLVGNRLASPVSESICAEMLSAVAQAGLIVSTKLHNHVAQGYADQLKHAHAAADELVRRLGGAA